METKVIAKVNNVYLLATKDGEHLIVNNLCEAIGVDLKSIKENTQLKDTIKLTSSVDPEDIRRYLFIIKSGYAIEWLYLLKDAEKEADEVIFENIKKCHKAISEYFFLRNDKISKLLERENNLLNDKLILQDKRSALLDEIYQKDNEIGNIKREIYDIQNAILEY